MGTTSPVPEASRTQEKQDMKMEEMILYRKVIAAYGAEAQKRQAVEECAELINALAKESRGRSTKEDIVTEIADVLIMAEQLSVIYGVADVVDEKHRKLERLANRLASNTNK